MIRTLQSERGFASLPTSRPDREPPRGAGLSHPLDGLRGSGVADRFCAWGGRSGRRYIFSVVPLAPDCVLEDLPMTTGAVVLAVRRAARGPRRVLWGLRIEDERGLAAARAGLAPLAGTGECEIHLHLLATDAMGRRAIVGDLDCPPPLEGRSA